MELFEVFCAHKKNERFFCYIKMNFIGNFTV